MANLAERDVIKSTDIPSMISEAIASQLAKFTSFSNPSLCYYGVQLKYTLELTLYSRGEEKIVAMKDELLKPEDSVFTPLDLPSYTTVSHDGAAGTKMAGRRGASPKHQPTEGSVIEPKLPPVKLQTLPPGNVPMVGE